MASLPYPLNWLYNHGRVGMAGMPYPPTDCRSYIKINMNTYLSYEYYRRDVSSRLTVLLLIQLKNTIRYEYKIDKRRSSNNQESQTQ